MKFRTRLCALVLSAALILTLAACGGDQTADVTPSPDASPSTTEESSSGTHVILPADFVPDPAVEDLCLATMGVPADFELFTVNGNAVNASSFLYRVLTSLSYLEESYGMPMDWSVAELAAYLKDFSYNSAVQQSLLPAKAKELGFDLTEDQTYELDTNIALSIIMMGSEEAFQEQLRKSGFTYADLYAANAAPYYYSQLKAGLFADRPTKDELNAFVQENNVYAAKHILVAFPENEDGSAATDEQKAQTKAEADDLLAQIRAAADPAAKFDELMHAHSDDGRDSSGALGKPEGYTFLENGYMVDGSGMLVTEFVTAGAALALGEISEPVETAYGYHILLRTDADNEETRSAVVSNLMNLQLADWVEQADVVLTEEYEALDLALFYVKYVAYQEAFALQAEAEAEASTEATAPSEG